MEKLLSENGKRGATMPQRSVMMNRRLRSPVVAAKRWSSSFSLKHYRGAACCLERTVDEGKGQTTPVTENGIRTIMIEERRIRDDFRRVARTLQETETMKVAKGRRKRKRESAGVYRLGMTVLVISSPHNRDE